MRQAALMNVVGIALSRSLEGPTGLAVVDPAGTLLHLSSAGSDEDLVEAVSPYVQDACVVAVDAPVSSTSATDRRPAVAEDRLGTARRASWIARRLGLDTNPRSRRARRAIEVSPSTAVSTLLGLPAQSGRPDTLGTTSLRTLVGCVEGLAEADPALRLDAGVPAARAWQDLRRQAEEARGAHDEDSARRRVDAVLGAYLGLLAVRARDGAARHDPSDAVRRYAELRPTLQEATDGYVRLVRSILDDAGLNYLTVSGRTKSLASYAAKASRTVDGTPVYPDPQRDITDQIGLRVITYVHADVQAVVDLLADQVAVHDDRDLGEETASEGRFGYASRHLLIGLPGPRDQDGRELPAWPQAQVQIRTVLQHAWAEFEHDIRYKGSIPEEHVPDFDRRFTLAAGLLELADREFTAIRDRVSRDTPQRLLEAEDDDPRLSPRDLAAFLAGQYSDAGWSRTDHYAWIAGIVLELGITSLRDLGDILRPVDTESLTGRMGYRYPPGAVRRLDDALLWIHGEDYIGLSANRDRAEALRSRLTRMRDTDPH